MIKSTFITPVIFFLITLPYSLCSLAEDINLDDLYWAYLIQNVTTWGKESLGYRYFLNDAGELKNTSIPIPLERAYLFSHRTEIPKEKVHLSIFYWHLTDQDPSQISDHRMRSQALFDQLPDLIDDQGLISDLYIFSGVGSLGRAQFSSISNLCTRLIHLTGRSDESSKDW